MANGEGRKAWWRVTKRVEIRQGLHPIGSSSALRVNSGSQAFSKSVWTRCRDEARHREQQDAQAMAVRRSNSETMGPVPVPVSCGTETGSGTGLGTTRQLDGEAWR